MNRNARGYWEFGYNRLKEYRKKYGDCRVPQKYDCEDGFSLGSWVSSQRTGKKNGWLNARKIALLDELGFVWDGIKDKWENGYAHLVAYKEAHGGDVRVPKGYESEDGFQLGNWVKEQRRRKKRLEREGSRMPEDEERRLNELGMIWDVMEDGHGN